MRQIFPLDPFKNSLRKKSIQGAHRAAAQTCKTTHENGTRDSASLIHCAVKLGKILLFLFCLNLPTVYGDGLPDPNQIQQELEQAKKSKTSDSHSPELVETLEKTLTLLDDYKNSEQRAKQYQQIIDDFPKIMQDLRREITNLETAPEKQVETTLSTEQLTQEMLKASSQWLEEGRQAQQEQERTRDISDSLMQLPQQHTEAQRALSESERQLTSKPTIDNSPQTLAKFHERQAAIAAKKARVNELELAQLSANNRQELARLRAEIHNKKAEQLDLYLQSVRIQLNHQRQREAELALAHTKQLAENTEGLPVSIVQQFHATRDLSTALNQQSRRLEQVAMEHRQANNQLLQIQEVLSTIREQSQWVDKSGSLGETLRTLVNHLPDTPKPQQLDHEVGQLRLQRLFYENSLSRLQHQEELRQDDGAQLTKAQRDILSGQLKIQRNLLGSLIAGCNTLILEVTKLQVSHSQIRDTLLETKEATHRYLFWTADVNPVNLSYPLEIAQDLARVLSFETFWQLGQALILMLTSRGTLLPLFAAILLVGASISSRRHYNAFLERSSVRVGKVNQDKFSLTLSTVLWSVLVALPLPALWAALGYGLQHAWAYPTATAGGNGVTATLPLLCVFMISAAFAHPKGLFIVHFGWSQARVARVMRYYSLTIGFIVPLIMLLISFRSYGDHSFFSSLGRLCFILICGALTIVTVTLKRAGIPLFLNKEGSGNNIVNRILWNLMICIPLASALASCIGYLDTAIALLARVETSVGIWLLLLLIYHIIRRWMLIQRRRIAFDRARQRRAEMIAHRARTGEEHSSFGAEGIEIEEPVINLDAISAQSLRLVRSLLTLLALVSLIFLWSEIYSAFSFLENIKLWNSSTNPITLRSIFISILVLIITTQLVRNMPALLELALLQHINLTPGTGYAITTLAKYLLLLIGALVGFSIIGIEWSKLQWLVAALGVGLGFGLQEIFANFVSGLIILFEKPIRIGDTVTIRELTGTVTRINTRAATIVDWDRKEIIMPNKAFITEQFINWSLSDSVTRVVLIIPAPANADSKVITDILQKAAERCTHVIDNPAPEAFLVDIQHGTQLFELRVHAAEMAHRMPLRHELHQLILEGFQKNNIELPFPPFQMRVESLEKNLPNAGSVHKPPSYKLKGTYKSGGV